MRINFVSTLIEGFKSIGFMEWDWSSSGINRIVAPNGSGKTTIPDALVWCLYGESLKGGVLATIPTKEAYRQSDFKGTRVATVFVADGVEYMVIRHYKYKGMTMGIQGRDSLMLCANNELLYEGRDKDDVQNAIIDLLGVDYKTFLSSIIFGQRLKRLIEAGEADKRAIFSHFFDLGFIDDALEKAKYKRADIESERAGLAASVESLAREIENMKQLKQNQDIMLTTFKDRTDKELADLRKSLLEVEAKITNDLLPPQKVERLPVPVMPNDSEYHTCERKYTELLARIEKLDKVDQIEFKKCDVCGQAVSAAKAKKILAERAAAVQAEIDNLSTEAEACKAEVDRLRIDYNQNLHNYHMLMDAYNMQEQLWLEYNEKDRAYAVWVEAQNNMINTAKSIKQRIYDIEMIPPVEVVDYDMLISDLQKNADIAIKSLELKATELGAYDFWVKTGFGASGLRNYVINAMLDSVNQALIKYSIGICVYVQMALEGANKKFDVRITTVDGVETSYAELSGGEKARVDIALTFALFDVLSASKTKFNILILDEAFENIDSEGVQDIFSIIREFSLDTNVFLITFIENIEATMVNNIYLSKINGLTIKE